MVGVTNQRVVSWNAYVVEPMAYKSIDSSLLQMEDCQDLPSNTGSEQSLELIRSWMSQCTTQHGNCGRGYT
jgi:hypothetical protein